MSNRLKSFAIVSLVFSLSCGVAIPAFDVVVKHTLAQTATSSDGKAEADKLFQDGVQQYRRGEYPKALQTYQRVLDIRRKLGDKAGIGQTLNNIGIVYSGLVQQEKALEVLQQALTIRREIKDRAGEGETLDNLGGSYLALFKEEEALKTLQQALEIRREVKDKAGEAVTLSRMGFTYTFLKQQDKGLKLLQQALAMHKELGDKFQEGLTLLWIAAAYKNIDDYSNALDWFNKALTVNREVGNRAREGSILQQIGYIYFNKKEYDNALKFYQQALPIVQEAGIRFFEASIFGTVGDTYFNQNKYDKAIEFYQKALPVAREIKDKSLESEVLTSLGDCYTKQEKYDLAIEFYQQALPLVRELKNKSQEAIILNKIGKVFLDQKKYERALEFYQQALPLTAKNTEQESRILWLIGFCYVQQGKYDLAMENSQKSLIIAREIKNRTLEAQSLAEIGLIYSRQKQFDKAIEFSQQALAIQRKELNNPSAQLDILMQIMRFYFVSASDLTLKKDFSRVMSQSNQALNLVPEALKIARELKNSTAEKNILEIQSQCYSLIGNYHLKLRELEKAENFIQQGLKIARQSKNLDAERYALSFLPEVYKDQRDISKVIELGQRELEIAQQLRDPLLEVQALFRLATTYSVLGDSDKGVQFSQQALRKSNEIDIQKLPKELQYHAYVEKLLALGHLSLIYKTIGEYDKAFEYAQQRLQFARTLKNPEFEVSALIGLGDVYQDNQEIQKAIEFTQQALRIARGINNSDLEAEALKKLSAVYTIKGDYQQALDSGQQILIIAEKTKSFKLKIDALNIQRQVYANQGNYQKTLELFQQALSIAKQNIDPYSEQSSLIEIGLLYKTLGDEQKSSEYLQQALTLAQKIKNTQYESITLFIIAYTYFGKDQPEKIIEYANRGLAILPKTKTITVEIMGNLVLSLGYGELKNEQKAMEAAQASLELARKSKNPSYEKTVLTFLGDLQRNFGKKQEAIKTYNQALAIKTQAKVVGADSGIYAGLGRAYADLNQPQLAIVSYKEAINRIEEVRSGLKLLTPELQASFLQSTVDFGKVKTSDIYRQLIDLLSSQGRKAEALEVSDLLKLQEIRDINRGSDTSKVPEVTLNLQEQKIQQQYGSIIALGEKIYRCEQDKDKCSDIQLKQLQDESDRLRKDFEKKVQELEKLAPERKEDFIKGYQSIVEPQTGQTGTLLVYPIILENKIWILWASAGGILGGKEVTNVGQNQLWKTVREYREFLKDPSTNITKLQATSKQLYQWLIAPIESEALKDKGIKHLVFSLDGATRYIPMGTLFDGQKYLIEKYAVSTVPAVSLTNSRDSLPKEVEKTPILALGVSQGFPNFPALTSVPLELDAIVKQSPTDMKGIYPGKKILNSGFNYETLRDNIIGQKIIHIATHGKFIPNNPKGSYLLMGTGTTLPISEIEQLRNLGNVHLIVLSACETALGEATQDGKEILGISNYFIGGESKAKAVIASLWVVSDDSTSLLMQLFYKNLATGTMTKSEALRQAQLKLLDGNNSSRNSERRGIKVNILPGTSSRNEKSQSGYSHPYYWAPFILIGNGL